jgi:hypothetical protein
VAVNIGRVGLLAGDITCGDPRYATLPPLDRRSVLEQALAAARALESVGARVAQSVVAECEPVLAAELAEVRDRGEAAS